MDNIMISVPFPNLFKNDKRLLQGYPFPLKLVISDHKSDDVLVLTTVGGRGGRVMMESMRGHSVYALHRHSARMHVGS